jgi:hypothetical protein
MRLKTFVENEKENDYYDIDPGGRIVLIWISEK